MRRRIALFLTVVMLFTLMIPIQGFAAGDNGLEQAIKAAREKFEIPATLTEFNYNVSTEGDRKIWYLEWNSKEGLDGNLSVRVDEKGSILGYYHYKPYDNNKKRLPKVSKQAAKAKAEDFIKKVNPQVLSQVKFQDNNNEYNYGDTYYFNFARTVNGIPFYNNSVMVEVNRETGEIQSYNYNWNDDLVFPKADKVISLEQAQKAFKEKLGLRLVYNQTFNENVKIYPAYTLKYANSFFIDAVTGEKVQMEPTYYPFYGANEKMMDAKSSASVAGGNVTLTPDELKAVEKVSKLLSKEEVEKIARDTKLLELSNDLKLTYANLNRDWQFKDDFNWYLNFQKNAQEGSNDFRNVSVTINAVTGEIKQFYTGGPYRPDQKPKYDQAASKVAVENFLKEFKKDKFAQTEYDDTFNNEYYHVMGKEPVTQYSFNYVRKVNGVPFPGNLLRVDYDAVNGKIAGFQMTWFDTQFPAVDKVTDINNIYEKLFKEVGFELQYKAQYRTEPYEKIMPENNNIKPEIKLVYDINRSKPSTFDANTGVLLNNNGEPYKELKPVQYTDISGHYAEKQITALAESGISLEGTEFKPDENITQKDFFRMLSKIANYYGPGTLSSDKELDQLYAFLIREGILKQPEKAPDANVTKEEGVKFLIRALKYDKVADIKGIFKTEFKDVDQINPDLVGYVTIAQGMKLISGNDGYFNPKAKLTRAQTAIILYNYLQN